MSEFHQINIVSVFCDTCCYSRISYAKCHWSQLNDIVAIICQFGYPLGITPPKIFQRRKRNVQKRSQQYTNSLLFKIIKYIGNYNIYATESILNNFLSKNYSVTLSMYKLKSFQLNVSQTQQLQSLLGLSNNKMRKMQRFIRNQTNKILLCNEKKLLNYQKSAVLVSGMTISTELQVCTRFVNSQSQMPVQDLSVYMADVRDAISRLCTATFQQQQVFIHKTLDINVWKFDIGWDKSNSGCAESVSVGIRDKFHGKYGSIVTTLTHEKVDEKYINYLQIAKINNKQEIVNQLLKFPNMIILTKTTENVTNDFLFCPMIFTEKTQSMVNNHQKHILLEKDGPSVLSTIVDITKLPDLKQKLIKIKPQNEINNKSKEKQNQNEEKQIVESPDSNVIVVTTCNTGKMEIDEEIEYVQLPNNERNNVVNVDIHMNADNMGNPSYDEAITTDIVNENGNSIHNNGDISNNGNVISNVSVMNIKNHECTIGNDNDDSKLWYNHLCVNEDMKEKKTAEINPGIVTHTFWSQKQDLVHIPGTYVVKLPSSWEISYPFDNNKWFKQLKGDFDIWIKHVTAGETQIWDKIASKWHGTGESASDKGKNNSKHHSQPNMDHNLDKQTKHNSNRSYSVNKPITRSQDSNNNNSNSNRNDSDIEVSDTNRSNSSQSLESFVTNDSIYDPACDSQANNTDDDAIEWKRVRQSKKQKKLVHQQQIKPYTLTEFHFNANSNLNRFQQSLWDAQIRHASTSSIQNDNLVFVLLTQLNDIDSNEALPQVNDPAIYIPLTGISLFDDFDGIEWFWISKHSLPNDYSSDQTFYCNIAIVHCELVLGILTVFIDVVNENQSQLESIYNLRKCYIISRCNAFTEFNVGNIINNTNNSCYILNRNQDNSVLIKMGQTLTDKNVIKQQRLDWFKIDLTGVFQSDNKGRNMLAGLSTSASKYPCPLCYASTDMIYSLPTPDSFQFQTRTVDEMQSCLQDGVDEDGVVNLKKSKGVQNVSIYQVEPHRYGVTTLHNFEGIFCVTMDTFKDMLCPNRGYKNEWQIIKDECTKLQVLFEKIVKIEDILQQSEQQQNQDDLLDWKQKMNNKLYNLKNEYIASKNAFDNNITNNVHNARMIQFMSIMDKHNINLYYVLSHSLQGVMCGRIVNARFDLIELAQTIDQRHGIIWKQLFLNLSYLYIMLKHKSTRNWTPHEMASVKTAYLDWYHQHVIAVQMWRVQGSIGIKCHYLLHDIEKAFFLQTSPWSEDDQRFENVNQHVESQLHTYCRYTKKDKLQLVIRRMNTESLNVRPISAKSK